MSNSPSNEGHSLSDADIRVRQVAQSLQYLAKQFHSLARDKGWYENERSLSEHVANIHAEVSELWEEYRVYGTNGDIRYRDSDGKPEGLVVEAADILIRLLDLVGHLNLNVAEAVYIKHLYNVTRPHRHGGKLA